MTIDRKSELKPPRPTKTAQRRAPPNPIDDPVQRAIGEQLKAVFEAVADQPVPNRFTELLRRLEEQERQKK